MKRYIKEGELVVSLEVDRVPTKGNLDGKGIPSWNNTMYLLTGFIRPGTPLMVMNYVGGRYVRVLGPDGLAWVQVLDIKHL